MGRVRSPEPDPDADENADALRGLRDGRESVPKRADNRKEHRLSDVWAWLTEDSVPPIVFFLWAVLFAFVEYRVYKKHDAFWEKECSKCL